MNELLLVTLFRLLCRVQCKPTSGKQLKLFLNMAELTAPARLQSTEAACECAYGHAVAHKQAAVQCVLGEDWPTSPAVYTGGSFIAKGAYGVVRLVQCKQSGRQYAVKTLSKTAMVASDDPKEWRTRISNAKKVSHSVAHAQYTNLKLLHLWA